MLPSINNRFSTEVVNKKYMYKQKSAFTIQKLKKNSFIEMVMPYIQEIKHTSTKYSPPKREPHIYRKKRIYTEANPSLCHGQQKVEYLPQQMQGTQPALLQPFQKNIGRKQVTKYEKLDSSTIDDSRAYKSKKKSFDERLTLLLQNSKVSKASKYDVCEEQFNRLPIPKQSWNHETLKSFIEILTKINTFFKKLDTIVILCLLKVGRIRLFEPEQIIQQQTYPVSYFGIVLWGQVLLKHMKSKMKIYLFPGDSLNEQLIFAQQKDSLQNNMYSKNKKGCFPIKETAKTKTKSAILFLKLHQYKSIYQELVKIGEKNNIMIAQNMMKWSYSKKKSIRKEFQQV